MTATSFWYQAALNAVAPLVTAVFGLLIAGIAINLLSRILQDRRAANELRHELIGQMTEVASTLYHYIGLFGRAQADVRLSGARDALGEKNEELNELRKGLQEEYVIGRAKAEVIEARLAAYFDESRVSVAWHAVIDCLSVRYYNTVGGSEKVLEEVYCENAKGWEGRYHTGLSAEVFGDDFRLYKAYACHLKTAAKLVFVCPLRPNRTNRRSLRAIARALEAAQRLGFDYKEPAQASGKPIEAACQEVERDSPSYP